MAEEAYDAPRRTVLIIEDEPRVAFGLAMIVAKLGHAVMAIDAASGAQALLREDASIFAVIADYNLSGPSTGLDLLGWMKEEQLLARRILISGLPIDKLHPDWGHTCDVFLPKPFTWRELAWCLGDRWQREHAVTTFSLDPVSPLLH